jgi:threonine/homoserine/homoserine lactone efflux protein
MGEDLSAASLAAVGIALSPLPFLLALALLGPDGLVRRAAAFVAGEALAVGVACAAALFALRGEDTDGGVMPLAIAVFEIAIGCVLALLLGAHLKRTRREGPQRWQAFLDRVSARKAFAAGAAMIVVNPKNLALTLAGATAILQLGYPTGGQLAGVLTFTAVSVSVLMALLVLARAFPKRARSVLDRVRLFVIDHERVLGAVLLVVLAAFFLVRGAADAAN